jgi:hypothetical protein
VQAHAEVLSYRWHRIAKMSRNGDAKEQPLKIQQRNDEDRINEKAAGI